MNDAEDVSNKLAELLRHPDDLDKISSLRAEFTRKKAAVDGQLQLGLKEQLAITQAGMTSISDGQRTVNLIKEEMIKIDRLCAEAQNMIKDFPYVDKIAQTHRNFLQVEEMKGNIVTFGRQLDELETMLRDDDRDMEHQPNLLATHYGLTKLRDIRDQAMDQVKSSADEDSGLELINNLTLESGVTLSDLFSRLDEVIDWFDEHIGQACMNLIPLIQSGNDGMIVRLALIVEEEEKKDKKVKALQEAQKDFKDLASRFKSMNSGQKELRGYKEKFLKAIELNAENQFQETAQAFREDPEKLDKATRWYFNDLHAVKVGMTTLMPKKWRIFKTYVDIYHRLMHDFLTSQIQDPELNPPHMLAIVHWISKYYAKMNKLGVPEDQLTPHVIDDREGDLVREYRALIIKAVDEWMDRLATNDRQDLLGRKQEALDFDGDVCRTKTIGDMWRMLREQLSVAASSDRPDVVEGVVDAMIRALKSRQSMWERLVDSESGRFETPNLTPQQVEALGPLEHLLYWLVAVANDQIACIDDLEEEGQTSYLTRFRADHETLVTPAYMTSSQPDLESLRDGYVDLGTHCIGHFASLLFFDCKEKLLEFFTPAWYAQKGMATILATLSDYLDEFAHLLHPSLQDIMIEELSDELLVRYLSAVSRNKGVKFRRLDGGPGSSGSFVDKIKDDVVTVFEYFAKYEGSFQAIKDKWRAVNGFVELLSADKGQPVTDAYERLKLAYWDVQMGWVETVLKARDDFDRSMLAAVKARAAEMDVERGPETIMSKVK